MRTEFRTTTSGLVLAVMLLACVPATADEIPANEWAAKKANGKLAQPTMKLLGRLDLDRSRRIYLGRDSGRVLFVTAYSGPSLQLDK